MVGRVGAAFVVARLANHHPPRIRVATVTAARAVTRLALLLQINDGWNWSHTHISFRFAAHASSVASVMKPLAANTVS